MLLIPGTGNGERGTGNRERESGNECTAVTRLRIQNGGQNKRKGPKNPSTGKINARAECGGLTADTLLYENTLCK